MTKLILTAITGGARRVKSASWHFARKPSDANYVCIRASFGVAERDNPSFTRNGNPFFKTRGGPNDRTRTVKQN